MRSTSRVVVRLDDVALVLVVVAVQQDAALEALADLADVVLQVLQRVDRAVPDDRAVADHADLGVALDDAVRDHAARDRAEPRDA